METNTSTEDTATCAKAVEAGLLGMITEALNIEGPGAHEAAVAAVLAGRAFFECRVTFTKSGTSIEAEYLSHGTRSHLVTATLRTPQDHAKAVH